MAERRQANVYKLALGYGVERMSCEVMGDGWETMDVDHGTRFAFTRRGARRIAVRFTEPRPRRDERDAIDTYCKHLS